jgi:hypothetical protein
MIRPNAIQVIHEVSAAEAAYTLLIGHVDRQHQGGQWLNGSPPEMQALEWPIILRSLGCTVTRGGLAVLGVPIGLHYFHGRSVAGHLARATQGISNELLWQGWQPCFYGFGLWIRVPGVAAGDVITLTGSYEVMP